MVGGGKVEGGGRERGLEGVGYERSMALDFFSLSLCADKHFFFL